MRSFLLTCLFLLFASAASNAAPPSFDCESARTLAEKTICSDNGLATLDTKIATVYRHLLATWMDQRRKSLISGQKNWLHLRDKVCEPVARRHNPGGRNTVAACFKRNMVARLAELETSNKNSQNEVYFIQNIGLQNFPYSGRVVNPDVEKLLDLPLKTLLSDNSLGDVGYYYSDQDPPQATIHTCREWYAYTKAGWSVSSLYAASVESGIEDIGKSTCGLIQLLRVAHRPEKSFLPNVKAFFNVLNYAARFFDFTTQTQGFDHSHPLNRNELTLGDEVRQEKIKLMKNALKKIDQQPKDELWLITTRDSSSINYVFRQARVSMSPVMEASFDNSGLDEMVIDWSESAGNSFRGASLRFVTALKNGGAILEVDSPVIPGQP